jgi:predicted N-acetyltransferase YhbS
MPSRPDESARMESVELGSLSAEQKRELEGDEEDPFDAAGILLRYRPKERHVALRAELGPLVASTGLLTVDVEVGGRRFSVVGFGGVIVHAKYRGRGLAREVLHAALGEARALGPAFVMLFCHQDRAGLYRKLGFVGVEAAVSVQQPDGYARMPQRTMWRGLTPGAHWPDGPVLVHSLPF